MFENFEVLKRFQSLKNKIDELEVSQEHRNFPTEIIDYHDKVIEGDSQIAN